MGNYESSCSGDEDEQQSLQVAKHAESRRQIDSSKERISEYLATLLKVITFNQEQDDSSGCFSLQGIAKEIFCEVNQKPLLTMSNVQGLVLHEVLACTDQSFFKKPEDRIEYLVSLISRLQKGYYDSASQSEKVEITPLSSEQHEKLIVTTFNYLMTVLCEWGQFSNSDKQEDTESALIEAFYKQYDAYGAQTSERLLELLEKHQQFEHVIEQLFNKFYMEICQIQQSSKSILNQIRDTLILTDKLKKLIWRKKCLLFFAEKSSYFNISQEATGRDLEEKTIIGKILSLSTLQLLEVKHDYFFISNRGEQAVHGSQVATREELSTRFADGQKGLQELHFKVFEILNLMARSIPSQLFKWSEKVLCINKSVVRMHQSHHNYPSSEAFLLNFMQVFLHFSTMYASKGVSRRSLDPTVVFMKTGFYENYSRIKSQLEEPKKQIDQKCELESKEESQSLEAYIVRTIAAAINLNNPIIHKLKHSHQSLHRSKHFGGALAYSISKRAKLNDSITKAVFFAFEVEWCMQLNGLEPVEGEFLAEWGNCSYKYSHIPEFLVEDIIKLTAFSFRSLKKEKLSRVLDFLVLILGSNEWCRNPFIRQQAMTLLLQARLEKVFVETNILRRLSIDGMMNLLIDQEKSYRGSFTDDKIEFRKVYNLLLSFIVQMSVQQLPLKQHLQPWKSFSQSVQTHHNNFLAFTNVFFEDSHAIIDLIFTHMCAFFHTKQHNHQYGLHPQHQHNDNLINQPGQNLNQNQHQQQQHLNNHNQHLQINQNQHQINGHLLQIKKKVLALTKAMSSHFDVIETLIMATEDEFLKYKEVNQKLSSFLIFTFTRFFTYHHFTELKAQGKPLFGIDLQQISRIIAKCFNRLSGFPCFIDNLLGCGRLTSIDAFAEASSRFVLENLIENDLKTRFNLFCFQMQKEFQKEKRFQEILHKDLPEQYLDPLVSEVMKKPVRLPRSGIIVDEVTILKHLLNNKSDPFTREPLKVEDLQPCIELQEEIRVYTEEKKKRFKQESQ